MDRTVIEQKVQQRLDNASLDEAVDMLTLAYVSAPSQERFRRAATQLLHIAYIIGLTDALEAVAGPGEAPTH